MSQAALSTVMISDAEHKSILAAESEFFKQDNSLAMD